MKKVELIKNINGYKIAPEGELQIEIKRKQEESKEDYEERANQVFDDFVEEERLRTKALTGEIIKTSFIGGFIN